MPVVDASVVVDWVAPAVDPAGPAARFLARLADADEPLLAPRLLPDSSFLFRVKSSLSTAGAPAAAGHTPGAPPDQQRSDPSPASDAQSAHTPPRPIRSRPTPRGPLPTRRPLQLPGLDRHIVAPKPVSPGRSAHTPACPRPDRRPTRPSPASQPARRRASCHRDADPPRAGDCQYYRWTRHPPGAVGISSPSTPPGEVPTSTTQAVATSPLVFMIVGGSALFRAAIPSRS